MARDRTSDLPCRRRAVFGSLAALVVYGYPNPPLDDGAKLGNTQVKDVALPALAEVPEGLMPRAG
jgi:hypothetical protein